MSTYIHAFAQRGWKAKETKIKKKKEQIKQER